MKKIIKSKILWISFVMFVMGTAFGYLENTHYQYIDENDVLVESWFMPLSFFCIFLGSVGVFFVVAKAAWLATNKKHN